MLYYLHRESFQEAYKQVLACQTQFPASGYVLRMKARILYLLGQLEEALQAFEILRELFPADLTYVDLHSHILYVNQAEAELAVLIGRTTDVARYSANTACALGNYYSLLGNHEEAIKHFEYSLEIDESSINSWVLLGHEYIELQKPACAIQCYRQVTSQKPRDYRSWYGLGQAYELLDAHHYSRTYFEEACRLAPHIPRNYLALGRLCVGINQPEEAIRFYEQAHLLGDTDLIALSRIADLHAQSGRTEEACLYHTEVLRSPAPLARLNTRDRPDVTDALSDTEDERPPTEINATKEFTPNVVRATCFLMLHYENTDNWLLAEKYARHLLDISGPEKEEAKRVLRSIHDPNTLNQSLKHRFTGNVSASSCKSNRSSPSPGWSEKGERVSRTWS
jgi:anaphase-promoting complex subunit 8